MAGVCVYNIYIYSFCNSGAPVGARNPRGYLSRSVLMFFVNRDPVRLVGMTLEVLVEDGGFGRRHFHYSAALGALLHHWRHRRLIPAIKKKKPPSDLPCRQPLLFPLYLAQGLFNMLFNLIAVINGKWKLCLSLIYYNQVTSELQVRCIKIILP